MKKLGSMLAIAALVIAVQSFAGSTSAFAAYGAIAYSPSTGGYGYSFRFNAKSAAKLRALNECKARVTGCQVVVWYRNACGSVARGRNGGWGSDWGTNRAQAESNAIRQCQRFTTNCRVVVWSCSG